MKKKLLNRYKDVTTRLNFPLRSKRGPTSELDEEEVGSDVN